MATISPLHQTGIEASTWWLDAAPRDQILGSALSETLSSLLRTGVLLNDPSLTELPANDLRTNWQQTLTTIARRRELEVKGPIPQGVGDGPLSVRVLDSVELRHLGVGLALPSFVVVWIGNLTHEYLLRGPPGISVPRYCLLKRCELVAGHGVARTI
jgi:hypothetical protein